MKTATKWRKAKVFSYSDDCDFDGVVMGNMGIFRHPDRNRGWAWQIVHVPSGLGIGLFKLLKSCKKTAEFIGSQQGADYLDRFATDTDTEGDCKKYRDLRNYQATLE